MKDTSKSGALYVDPGRQPASKAFGMAPPAHKRSDVILDNETYKVLLLIYDLHARVARCRTDSTTRRRHTDVVIDLATPANRGGLIHICTWDINETLAAIKVETRRDGQLSVRRCPRDQ